MSRYPQATDLLITADAGGSNGYRSRAWKQQLQHVADDLRLRIHVSHFPPGTSKWNKIEHRLFCHITENWRGRSLRTFETIVALTLTEWFAYRRFFASALLTKFDHRVTDRLLVHWLGHHRCCLLRLSIPVCSRRGLSRGVADLIAVAAGSQLKLALLLWCLSALKKILHKSFSQGFSAMGGERERAELAGLRSCAKPV